MPAAPGRRPAAGPRGPSAPAAAARAPAPRRSCPAARPPPPAPRRAGRPPSSPAAVAVDHQRDDAAAVRLGQRRRLGRGHRAAAGPQAARVRGRRPLGARPRVVQRRRHGHAGLQRDEPQRGLHPRQRHAEHRGHAASSRRRRRARPPRVASALSCTSAGARAPSGGQCRGQPGEVGRDVLARLGPQPHRAGDAAARTERRVPRPGVPGDEQAPRRRSPPAPPSRTSPALTPAAGPAPGPGPRGTGW